MSLLTRHPRHLLVHDRVHACSMLLITPAAAVASVVASSSVALSINPPSTSLRSCDAASAALDTLAMARETTQAHRSCRHEAARVRYTAAAKAKARSDSLWRIML
eukprot:scaffold20246_cov129-Isochrysis_galbana.AAC.1